MALTNNDIIKKLRVALKMRDEDIVQVLKLVNFKITTSELGAFFRNEDHPKYMPLQDQILRNFLDGLIIYKRGPRDGSGAKAISPNVKPQNQKTDFKKPRGPVQAKTWQERLEKDVSKPEKPTAQKPVSKRPRISGKIGGRPKKG
ncbi:MAG: DUF1456 family protein [Flavobacteriales bacterium]|nr:DUF1456 family protein [Flavobacteriales bacterium]